MIHSIIYSILRSKKSSVRGFDVIFGASSHKPWDPQNIQQNAKEICGTRMVFVFFSNIGLGVGGGIMILKIVQICPSLIPTLFD